MQKVELDPSLMTDQQRMSYQRLLAISFPLIIQGLVTTVMAMVDRVFMSNYDVTQFSAITPAFSVGFSIGAFFNGIIWFISTLVAQYYGAGHHEKLKLPMWQGIFFSCFATLILLAIMPFGGGIFDLFHHEPAIVIYETIYLKYILGAMILGLFSASIWGYFAGTGRTSISMWAAIVGNITNILLDWWFIYGGFGLPAMGINGAGLATLFGALTTLIFSICVILVEGKKPAGKKIQLLKPVWDADVFKRLMFFGMPAAVQLTADSMGFTVLMLFMGMLGWAPTAAASIVLSLQLFSYLPIMEIATGCGIMVGQERGAGRLHNIPVAIKKTMFLAVGLSAVISFAMLMWPDVMIMPFNNVNQPERMLEIAKYFGPMLTVAAMWLIVDAVLNVYLHSLKALGDTMFIMFSYLIMIPISMVLPGWLVVKYLRDPNVLFSVVLLFVLALLVMMMLRYHSGAWKKLHVISLQDEAPVEAV